MNDEALADRAAMTGDYRTALNLLRAIEATSPPDLDRSLKMAAMARATGDAAAALTYTHDALAIDPVHVSALLLKATILHNAGDSNAGEYYGRAVAQAPDPVPPHLMAALDIARHRYAVWQNATRSTVIDHVSHVATLTPELLWFIDASMHLAPAERDGPTHYCYPSLSVAGFHDPASFPWIADLEALVPVITAEFTALLQLSPGRPYIDYPKHVPVDQWRDLNGNADWSAIHLIERGTVDAVAARHCPETLAFLRTLPQPDIQSIGPNAMFSLLAPHTHIPPHTGITNTRLICHLPLVTPAGCWFRVGDETRNWQDGKAWIFDDTIEHEAMNPSKRLRAVLIFDVWHPDLDANAQRGISAVMRASAALHAL